MLECVLHTWFASWLVMMAQNEHFQLLSFFFELITLARSNSRGTETVIVMLKTDTGGSTWKRERERTISVPTKMVSLSALVGSLVSMYNHNNRNNKVGITISLSYLMSFTEN